MSETDYKLAIKLLSEELRETKKALEYQEHGNDLLITELKEVQDKLDEEKACTKELIADIDKRMKKDQRRCEKIRKLQKQLRYFTDAWQLPAHLQ